jgi:hypothetical protein
MRNTNDYNEYEGRQVRNVHQYNKDYRDERPLDYDDNFRGGRGGNRPYN